MKQMKFTKEEIIAQSKDYSELISGVYFLINKDEIIYVGSARNINNRLRIHGSNSRMWFDKIFIIKVKPKEERIDLEKHYIETLKPKFNFAHNPDCKGGKKEVFRTFLSSFSSYSEVAKITNYDISTVEKVINGKTENLNKEKVIKIEDIILERNNHPKRKQLYLDYRKTKYNNEQL